MRIFFDTHRYRSIWLVAKVEGSYPIPFRTRKSSPPTPMVLHRQLCGRVGHCQPLLELCSAAPHGALRLLPLNPRVDSSESPGVFLVSMFSFARLRLAVRCAGWRRLRLRQRGCRGGPWGARSLLADARLACGPRLALRVRWVAGVPGVALSAEARASRALRVRWVAGVPEVSRALRADSRVACALRQRRGARDPRFRRLCLWMPASRGPGWRRLRLRPLGRRARPGVPRVVGPRGEVLLVGGSARGVARGR